MTGTIHIIGGGLAGLSAAVEASGCGKHVIVHEAAGQCGGRARSFHDKAMGCDINNGNHLFFSSNKALFRYLAIIGALDTITGPQEADFPFYDLSNGERWTVQFSKGRFPFWLFSPHRRVRGMHLRDVKALCRLMEAKEGQTVSDFLGNNAFSRRFLEPLAVSVLNTPTQKGNAKLLANVLKETLTQGGKALLPRFAKDGLSKTLVDPALTYLDLVNTQVKTHHRLSALESHDGRIHSLLFDDEKIDLHRDDRVIFALPAPATYLLLKEHIPGISTPRESESIINLHYRVSQPLTPLTSLETCHFMGIIGGLSEWVFVGKDVLSVTISAANRFENIPPEELKERVWQELREACSVKLVQPLPAQPEASRLIWEKRATFEETPQQERYRLGAATPLVNLAICGDWTDTCLPATLEGAVRSGITAVNALGLKEPSRPS